MISKLFRELSLWGFVFLLSPGFVNAQSIVLSSNEMTTPSSNKRLFLSTVAEPSFAAIMKSGGEVILKNMLSGKDLTSVEVERAGDDKRFASIGLVSDFRKETLFSDKHPLSGISSYRLKMTDNAGLISYSAIVSVEIKEYAMLSIFPNPASSKMTVAVDGGRNEGFLKIYTLNGEELYSLRLFSGKIETELDVTYLRPGTYLIVYMDGKSKLVKQFSKS